MANEEIEALLYIMMDVLACRTFLVSDSYLIQADLISSIKKREIIIYYGIKLDTDKLSTK